MLTHEEFHRLRLSQFVERTRITQLSGWEFLGREWIGEAVGFTEWLRPLSSPERLGSIALDLEELPPEVVEACLSRIGLPLHRHMTLPQLVALFGEPLRVLAFVEDRATYEFRVADPDPYDVSCTVLADGGLGYLVITATEGSG